MLKVSQGILSEQYFLIYKKKHRQIKYIYIYLAKFNNEFLFFCINCNVSLHISDSFKIKIFRMINFAESQVIK